MDAPARRTQPTPPEGIGAIRIGDDVWIGTGAMVLKGVTVGDRAVIAAMYREPDRRLMMVSTVRKDNRRQGYAGCAVPSGRGQVASVAAKSAGKTQSFE